MHKDECIMLKLLDEFAELCKKSRVSYYLIEQELLSAFRQKRIYEAETDVCMTLKDYLKVEQLLKKQKGRIIESIRTNTDMPGVYYRYVNTETLMYVLKYHKVRHEHGVAVNIHILRDTGEAADLLCRYETMMECGIEGHLPCDSTMLEKAKRHPWFFKLRMERMLNKASLKSKNKASMLKLPGVSPLYFPEKFWSKDKSIVIEKYSFKTTKNAEEYLQIRYGVDYVSKKIINLRDNYQVLSEPNMPYRTTIDKIESFLQREPEFWEAHNRYSDFFNNEYRDLLEKESADWEVLFFIGDRMNLWKMYAPQRENIRTLWKQARKDELFFIFKEYFQLFQKHLKAGRVLYFDEEFWQICSALWEQCGYQEIIEEAQDLMQNNIQREVFKNELSAIYAEKEPLEKIRMRVVY